MDAVIAVAFVVALWLTGAKQLSFSAQAPTSLRRPFKEVSARTSRLEHRLRRQRAQREKRVATTRGIVADLPAHATVAERLRNLGVQPDLDVDLDVTMDDTINPFIFTAQPVRGLRTIPETLSEFEARSEWPHLWPQKGDIPRQHDLQRAQRRLADYL